MSTYPKITIITPSFNQGAYIENTIVSVLNQNYPNLQYIIIDGGSTDNTIDIIKKYESKIDFWVSEKDEGQSNAINKGLQRATGDLVNWLNSDDQLEEGALMDLAGLYNSHPHCKLFIGQTEFFSAEMKYGKGGKVVFQTREITFAFGQVNQPAMFYKKEAIEKIGLLDESLHYCMDIDWWLKYLLHFDLDTIVETATVWAKFRFHDSSKTIISPLEFKNEKQMIYENFFSSYHLPRDKRSDRSKCHLLPNETTLDIRIARNYYNLWRSDELSLEGKRMSSFRFWLKVVPFKLIYSEKKRYLAVLKNIIFRRRNLAAANT